VVGGRRDDDTRSAASAALRLGARERRLLSAILFTTILIDFVGFSILIPVLPIYAQTLGASETEIGLMLALYSLGLVLFLPVWGWISDRVGRRPVLLVCLLGTAVSFAWLALADTIWEIYAARALGGFFGASIGTAQAYMTDITDESERAHGMGLIGAAFGIGFVLGNLLGGVLQAIQPGLPFYATAGAALASCVLAFFWLPESRPAASGPVSWARLGRSLVPAPILVVAAAHDNRTRLYLYLFFHIFLCFSTLEAMFALYAHRRFGWSEWNVGLFMAYVGTVIGLVQGVGIRRLTLRYSEAALVRAGLLLTGSGMVALPFAANLPALAVVASVLAIGNGIAFPAFTSLFTKACGTEEAGEALGQSQAMAQTGRTLGALTAGWVLERIAPGAPFVLGGVGMLGALAIFLAAARLLVPRADP
jgi:MFS family permease